MRHRRRSGVKKPFMMRNDPLASVVVTGKVRAFRATRPKFAKPMWLVACPVPPLQHIKTRVINNPLLPIQLPLTRCTQHLHFRSWGSTTSSSFVNFAHLPRVSSIWVALYSFSRPTSLPDTLRFFVRSCFFCACCLRRSSYPSYPGASTYGAPQRTCRAQLQSCRSVRMWCWILSFRR
jgi:hypothetical protein